MENGDNTAEALAEIRRLEQLIQNCRHGGPAHTDRQDQGPWFQQSTEFAQLPTPLDRLIDMDSQSGYTKHNIQFALVVTINTLVDNFHFARN